MASAIAALFPIDLLDLKLASPKLCQFVIQYSKNEINRAIKTERKAKPTFANLNSVTKMLQTTDIYCEAKGQNCKSASMGAVRENTNTAVVANTQTIVRTMAK